jgi:hypothetical protein
MDRKQFIARLEEVGFRNDSIAYGRDVYSFELKYQIEYIRIALPVNHSDVFISLHPYELYGFNELEKFLIDKGIVEKPFDAHAYLLNRGWKTSQGDYLTFIKDDRYTISIKKDKLIIEQIRYLYPLNKYNYV